MKKTKKVKLKKVIKNVKVGYDFWNYNINPITMKVPCSGTYIHSNKN